LVDPPQVFTNRSLNNAAGLFFGNLCQVCKGCVRLEAPVA
jgi:hypothetical protein